MGQNSAMWGREAKFVCGDEEKGEFYEFFENFVSFLVDRSKIFIEMRLAEVGGMIYIVLYYYLRRASRAGAETGINPGKKNFSPPYT